jgi:hypothetical protein
MHHYFLLATVGQFINGWLAGTLFFLLIFFAFCSGFIRALQSRTWPTTKGRVLESKVEENNCRSTSGSTRPDISYQPFVRYRYEVSGKTQESKQISIGVCASSRQYAEGIIAQYPVGAKVTVHHHPKLHYLAVLEPGGYIIPLVISLLTGAIFIFVAITWVKVSLHPTQRPWGQYSCTPSQRPCFLAPSFTTSKGV